MISYNLQCIDGHVFEGWFSSSAAFDAQAAAKQVTCAVCGSASVSKAIMAPAVSGTKKRGLSDYTNAVQEQMAAFRSHVEANCENVGDKFPEEARKIHYGEAEERGILGQATPKDVKDLVDEGIPVAPLPPVKPKGN